MFLCRSTGSNRPEVYRLYLCHSHFVYDEHRASFSIRWISILPSFSYYINTDKITRHQRLFNVHFLVTHLVQLRKLARKAKHKGKQIDKKYINILLIFRQTEGVFIRNKTSKITYDPELMNRRKWTGKPIFIIILHILNYVISREEFRTWRKWKRFMVESSFD